MKKRKRTSAPTPVPHVKHRLVIALSLMLLSNLGWLLPITFIPFLPISLEDKAVAVTLSIIMGHVLYNAGLILAGSHVVHLVKRHRQNLIFFWTQAGMFFRSLMKNFRNTLGR